MTTERPTPQRDADPGQPGRPAAPASMLRAPRVRAELVAAGWELFSALLFISTVVPAAFSTPWPAVLLLSSMALSAALTGAFVRRGDRGLALAAALRTVSWPLAALPLIGLRAPSPLPAPDPGLAGEPPSWLGLLVAALAFGLMAGGMRRAIYRRILGIPFTAGAGRGAAEPESDQGHAGADEAADSTASDDDRAADSDAGAIAATLRPRLAESAMTAGIVGGHVML